MTQDPNFSGQTPPPAGSMPLNYPAGMPYDGPSPTKDETNLAVLCYILGIVTWFVGPLIIWLMKKDSSKFVDDQGREVLNWEITLTIVWVITFLVGMVLHLIPILGTILMFLIHFAIFVCAVIFSILGAVKASQGIAYRYPISLRLIK